jgi:hypothetical protein
MTDLTKAIAEVRHVTPPSSPWEAGDLSMGSSPVDYHIATILNAVVSGTLIPATERDAAVAAALKEAAARIGVFEASARERGDLSREGAFCLCVDELHALITRPQADALARVRAEAVKVKPLAWDDNGSADVYRVTFANGQGPKAFIVSRGSKIIGWHDDPNEAKAAAQADHNARIRAAIGGVE